MTRVHSTVLRLLVLVAIVVIAVVPAPRAPAARTSNLHAAMARLPVRFEANAGQYDDAVEFVTRRAGMTAFLTDDGTTLVLRDTKAPHNRSSRPATARFRSKGNVTSRVSATSGGQMAIAASDSA